MDILTPTAELIMVLFALNTLNSKELFMGLIHFVIKMFGGGLAYVADKHSNEAPRTMLVETKSLVTLELS